MQNERGYSLVELLVVLALMGLIAIAMSGGIRFGARVWEKAGTQVEALEQTQGAQTLLRNVLANIAPRFLDPTVPSTDTFAGGSERMSFTGAMPSALEGGGLARYTLSVVRTGKTMRLQIAWRATHGAPAEQRQVLIEGARTISFAY